jgi:hypothetical protein
MATLTAKQKKNEALNPGETCQRTVLGIGDQLQGYFIAKSS